MSIHAVFDTQGVPCCCFRQHCKYRSFVFSKCCWSPLVCIYCMLLLCKTRWMVRLTPCAVYLSSSADSSSAFLQLSGQQVSSILVQSSCLPVERIFLLFQLSVFGYPLKRSNKSLEFELTGWKNSLSWKGGWISSQFFPAVTRHIPSHI